MAQATNEVVLYEADGEYRVFPPVVRLNAAGGGPGAEKLILTNLTDDDLVFYADDKVLNNGGNSSSELLPAGKSTTTAKAVKSNGNNSMKIFSYQVVAPVSGKKAKGNSDPKIIIDN